MILSLLLSCLWEELRKTEFMPIGICEVKIPLPPGAILDCGRGQSSGDSGIVDGLDIVHAENGTPPPGGRKMRCQGKVDQRVPSLEGTEPRLGAPVDQCEAKLSVEGNGLWHRPDGKGHGANVVYHAGGLSYRHEFIPIYGSRCLRGTEAPTIAGGPCPGRTVPLAFLEITHVTVDEVQHLVPSFEVVWQAQMACGCTLYHVRMPLVRSQPVVKSG